MPYTIFAYNCIMNRITINILFLFLVACAPSQKNSETLVNGRNIITRNAMVVSAHPQASYIGASILARGGNAVDAAVATELALAVCYPEAGNLGGGGFMVIRKADGKSFVIDYREKAPGSASRDMFIDGDGNVPEGVSTDTHLASGVPGTPDGMITANSRHGRLPFRDVIQPAIDLAKNGFRITAIQASDLNSNRENFINRNSVNTAFVKDGPWKEGDLLVQEDLARTLERIRDNGREGFYSGVTALLIEEEMKRGNGVISRQDLLTYSASEREPLTSAYRGYRIITVPPPSGGGVILIQLLKMTEQYNFGEWGFNSYQAIHLIAEAERRAFADRAEHLGDPDFMNVRVSQLLDTGYLRSRMSTFDPERATSSADILPGAPGAYSSEQTTHYSVVDKDGNAVSATTTLNGTFGSSIVVQGAGFLLNNQMDDFSVKPGLPNMYGLAGGEINAVSSGKKMLSSMTPVIVEKDGKLFFVAGSPGGSTIPTTVYQIITNVIDYGMGIQESVDAGRFHHQWLPDMITFEKSRIDNTASAALREMGHVLRERSSIGRVSAIMIRADGTIEGGADKRGDNTSCGF